MHLQKIIGQILPGKNSHNIEIPPSWHQGRTAYGGFSSCIAFEAAKNTAPDLPPLRSAQIAFVGPLAGPVTVEATMLRRGRNTAFVKSEISSNGEIGLTCTFIFMHKRESHVDFHSLTPPEFPPIPDADSVRSGPPEFFTHHLQYPEKRLVLGQNLPRLANWHRIIEREGVDPITEVLCIGDALPPAAMGLMSEKGMVSSMNWQVNMLTDRPETDDGWWYVDSQTHDAARGASSQYMSVWNSRGEAILTGMQSVAIFS